MFQYYCPPDMRMRRQLYSEGDRALSDFIESVCNDLDLRITRAILRPTTQRKLEMTASGGFDEIAREVDMVVDHFRNLIAVNEMCRRTAASFDEKVQIAGAADHRDTGRLEQLFQFQRSIEPGRPVGPMTLQALQPHACGFLHRLLNISAPTDAAIAIANVSRAPLLDSTGGASWHANQTCRADSSSQRTDESAPISNGVLERFALGHWLHLALPRTAPG